MHARQRWKGEVMLASCVPARLTCTERRVAWSDALTGGASTFGDSARNKFFDALVSNTVETDG